MEYAKYAYDLIFKDMDLKDAKVLDAMCGGGKATHYFIDKEAEVTGLDISEKCCELYPRHFRNCDVICSSIINTKVVDASFDLIFTNSLHHVHPNVEQAVNEIHRILKPGGYFCCMEPHAGGLFDMAVRKIWYKLDSKYFKKNEGSVEIDQLLESNKARFKVIKRIYGGNIGYFLWSLFIALRIPNSTVNCVADPLMNIESYFNRYNNMFLSCWVLLLIRKTGL